MFSIIVDVDFPSSFVVDLADVVVFDAVGPFLPFDVAEVLILEDLGRMQVLVEDHFAALDVLARFDVGCPSRILLVDLMLLLLRMLLSIFGAPGPCCQ